MREWHLNDLTAGCEHQRAEKWNERPIDPSSSCDKYVTLKPGEHGMLADYTGWNMLAWVWRKDHPEGLLSHPCPVCGYKYGSAWLKRELPPEVVETIKAWST
jgi:hypothetical protein